MATRLSTAARNAAADSIVALVDAGPAAGTIQVRSGVQPATPNAAAIGTLLCTFTLADPSYGAAVAGVATPALSTTGVADDTTTISTGATITITSGNITMPLGS